MGQIYKCLYQGGRGEQIEKKSRFVATTHPVKEEAEALAFIEAMKKKYWDANHNCSAYVIGKNQELQRCSDDGEPQGTAGRPMLDVLLGEDIHNIAVVVTRYFGGTLLGTGGLVRAYSRAVQEGLKKSVIVKKQIGTKLMVKTGYNGIGKMQYLAAQNEIWILNSEYGEDVSIEFLVPSERLEETKTKITEATSGKAILKVEKEMWYGEIGGEIHLFDDI